MTQIKQRGYCRACGQPVVQDWGGACNRQYHCIACGLVTDYAGKHYKTYSSEELAATIKDIIDSLAVDRVRAYDVLSIIKKHTKVTPQIRRDSLNEIGLDYDNHYIYRLK